MYNNFETVYHDICINHVLFIVLSIVKTIFQQIYTKSFYHKLECLKIRVKHINIVDYYMYKHYQHLIRTTGKIVVSLYCFQDMFPTTYTWKNVDFFLFFNAQDQRLYIHLLNVPNKTMSKKFGIDQIESIVRSIITVIGPLYHYFHVDR